MGGGRGREREREREEKGGTEGEGERECVCVCVDRFIVECPSPPPLSVYLALRANDKVSHFTNVHLHYITYDAGQSF